MGGRLEISHWVSLNNPVYDVAMTGDGQFIAAGAEQGVSIFNPTGECLLVYPPAGYQPIPVRQLAVAANMARLYIGARQGWVIRLDLEQTKEGLKFRPQLLYEAKTDLNTLSLSANEQLLAVGHLGPAISLLRSDGQLLWRRHPADGTATEGKTWTVALDPVGENLYIASAGSTTNYLVKLAANQGTPLAYRLDQVRLTGVAVLPAEAGVVIAQVEAFETGRLIVYTPDLTDIIWERSFDEPITAIAIDRSSSLLAVGSGFEGQITLIHTPTGQEKATKTLKAVVNGLALVQGNTLAAALQDGHLALIRYIPDEFRL